MWVELYALLVKLAGDTVDVHSFNPNLSSYFLRMCVCAVSLLGVIRVSGMGWVVG